MATASRHLQWLLRLSTRHPVTASFVVALVVRLIFVVVTNLMHDGVLIPDEGQYLVIAEAASKGWLTNQFWPGYGQAFFDSMRTFTWPLTALFWLFGPWRILGQLLAVLSGSLTAAATAALGGRFLRRPYALAAGLTVAIFPSQILWSSVVLRESLIWASLAAIALTIEFAQRRESGVQLLLAVTTAGLLFVVLVGLREQTAVLALWCMVLALLVGRGRRSPRILCAIGLLVVAPITVGMGPGAVLYADSAIHRLGLARGYMSLGSDSSFDSCVDSSFGGDAGTNWDNQCEPLQAEVFEDTVPEPEGSVVRCENQMTGGKWIHKREAGDWACVYSYYSKEWSLVDNRISTSATRIPAGLYDTMIRPLPWESGPGQGRYIEGQLPGWVRVGAGLESGLLWLPLYVLGVYGIWKLRDRRLQMAFPLLIVLAISLGGAMTHGNLGTAFRHRGQMLFAFAVLAMGGVQTIADKLSGRIIDNDA